MSFTPARRPLFSVLVTAYNRQDQVERCIRSCTSQTFEDFEIVVVDDASTDATASALAAMVEPRLRVLTHPCNRGISPARATAVEHARGEWLVMLDSDWELLPHSLQRLKELTDERPAGIRIVRSRLRCDDGTITPGVMPSTAVTDYRGRLEWLEAIAVHRASSDAGHCIHRSVFDAGNYPRDRRGGIETLWETTLALRESSLWVDEVLGLQHTDAVNSVTRDIDAARLTPRLLEEAADVRWMAETMLAEHGDALARHAPHYRMWLLGIAASESFLCGDRRGGIRHTLAVARAGVPDPRTIATLLLGLVGPQAVVRAKTIERRRRVRSSGRAGRQVKAP